MAHAQLHALLLFVHFVCLTLNMRTPDENTENVFLGGGGVASFNAYHIDSKSEHVRDSVTQCLDEDGERKEWGTSREIEEGVGK